MFKVVQAPDNRLRIKTKPVKKITPELLKTTQEMIKLTKTFVDPEGVGLAATQIGKDEQYFVAKMDNEKFQPFFNPEILSYSKKTKMFFEGCLSIPDYYGEIERPISVKVRYLNAKGEKIEKTLTGFKAWFYQHEYDHLQGRLFMDIVLEQKAKLYKMVGKDATGADVFEEINLI